MIRIPGQVNNPGPNIISGTWTPTIQDSSLSDGEGQTYINQIGNFIKIDNCVFISGRLTISSLGTLTTTDGANLAGLPFTSKNGTGDGGIVLYNAGNLSITAGYGPITGSVMFNNTYITLTIWDVTTGVTSLLLSELTAAGDIIFFGHYFT